MVADPPRPPPPPIDGRQALFLDVDGTLLEFAAHPDAVRVPTPLRDTLARLHRRLAGAVALVSGRPLEVLDALFEPLHLPAAGLHGLELRNGGPPRPAPEPGAELAAVLERARAFAAQRPGTVVEDKGSSIGLHWRSAPEYADDMQRFATQALEQLPGHCLQLGKQVAELRPRGADKGDAIATLMQQPPFRGRHAVFAGDDLTDEHGFEVINASGGTSVLVGDREPSAATHRLDNTRAVLDWLQQGADA